MKSCSDAPKPNLYPNMDWKTLLLSVVVISSVSLLFILPSSNPFSIVEPIQVPNQYLPLLRNTSLDFEQLDKSASITHKANHNQSTVPSRDDKGEECDLFAGRWVTEPRGSIYTNWSCPMLPDSKNCGKYGKGLEHVFWKWKPQGCDLPRFDPNTFLSIVRGKKMAFVGDSVARNHMESLLCLLTQAETPTDIYKDAEDKFRTWYFPSHNFTLMALWAEYLVERAEIVVNGTGTNTFDLHVDRLNPVWAEKLPELHYVIISAGNWLLKKLYLHENRTLIGCANCKDENLTQLGTAYVLRRIFRTALQFISRCEECNNLLTVLRTYSPTHFEHGLWFSGGYCNRTQLLNDNELYLSGHDLEYKKIQLEEVERIKVEKNVNRRFELLDVTKAMMARADGHPGSNWKWMKNSNSDCLHWCLPGPIDMWNDLLLAIVKKNSLP